VFTSLISKSGTTVLRLVSIPIAISQLSLELFGVYTTITMAVSLVDMLHIGIGPALTRELPKALAAGDREKEKTIFVTSIILSTALTLLAILVTSIVILNVPITTLFGPEFLSVSDTMYRAIWVGIAILGLEMICKTFEMARDGYLETRFTNAWGAAGNVVGAITLVSGIWFFPTIEFLLLAVNGSVAFAKLGNTIHLLIQRPYLFPRFSLFRKKLVPSLALNSARFTVTYALAAALECNLMAYLIGRAVGPAAVGVFNIMVTVLFSLTGIVVMFTKPYWPALMDAFERKDIGWIKLTSTRLRLGGLGFALLCGVGLTSLGPWLLPLWVGEEFYSSVTENFQMDRFALGAFSIYFAAFIWRHINQTLALGVGGLNPVVFTVLAEGVFLFCASSIALVNTGKISFIYLAMAGSILLFSSWLFPCIFRRGERSLSTSNAEPSEPDQSPLP
tara:strand:+ start:326 stop:1669 length:1344 start_codon:yes stop_codon:yes gene_type:complete